MHLTTLLYFLYFVDATSYPNIIVFLTDGQDQMLGGSFPQKNGVGPMGKTQALMADMGITAENFYTHTPICNPSRCELLTGRYFHNIKSTQTQKHWNHVNQTKVWNHTFVRELKEKAGYTTGLFGKFSNGKASSVPPGFDAWMENGGSSYISPTYQLYNITGIIPGLTNNDPKNCWRDVDHSADPRYGCWLGTADPSNYSTSVIGNVSMAWITSVVRKDPNRPFFAYIAPKAPHDPFIPAAWYADYWNDTHWPAHEPRPEAWNCSAESRKDHHGDIATQPMITEEASRVMTDIFKNRWRTLMSVDDLIADVIELCGRLGIADNTYFFFTTDHGFQLGEFNMLMGKREVYEWNTKIHLLVRGPGITPGSILRAPATPVDLTPTLLGLAGLQQPSWYDGRSLVPFLFTNNRKKISEATALHLQSFTSLDRYMADWRDTLFFEFYYVGDATVCTSSCRQLDPSEEYPNRDIKCGDLTPFNNSECWGKFCAKGCYPSDTNANNYIAIRTMPWSAHGNMLYAEFQTGNQFEEDVNFSKPSFYEMYNVSSDTWMMNNLASETGSNRLHEELLAWYSCAGNTCQ